jgi:hypothetical protein
LREQQYDGRITFRMTRLTRDQIIERARAEGISMTDLIRAIVTGYLDWVRRKDAH